MKNFFKNKAATLIIILSTFILAGVAIFTAIRLYQLRQTSISPNAPESKPKAVEETAAGACSLTFTLTLPTATPTPSPQCNSTCTTDAQCPSNMKCYQPPMPPCPSGQVCTQVLPPKVCRKASCLTKTSCICDTPTPTPTPTATPGPGTPNACGGTCGSDSNCQTGLVCYNNFCRNPSCNTSSDCVCRATPTNAPTATPKPAAPIKTPTPTPIVTVTPTPTALTAVTPAPTATAVAEAPSLPASGTNWPTIVAAWFGAAVILGSLLLAL